MKPIKYRGERWAVFIPAKLNNGKRAAKYFPSRNAAQDFIAGFKHEQREFGKSAVTSEERRWIEFARMELGDLSKLPEVIRHWKQTSADSVKQTRVLDAVNLFNVARQTEGLDRRTLRDDAMHVGWFGNAFESFVMHDISADHVREYLNKFSQGWSRRTAYNKIRLLFAFAIDRRMIALNPMLSIKAPKTPAKEPKVYRVEDFRRLIQLADEKYPDLVPFLAFSAFGFMRAGELVHQFANKPVLRWEHVIWSENRVYVPEEVAKQTRRETGNRREFPIGGTLRHWIEPYRRDLGRIVDQSEPSWRGQFNRLCEEAGFERIDNGLRKSAISYFIAANPETGIIQMARWAGNSEAISRRFYLSFLTRADGEAWFGIRRG